MTRVWHRLPCHHARWGKVTTVGHRLAFIGGLHRSGTSPLHRLLSSHPLVSGFEDTGVPEDEGQHLQSLIPAARAHGGPGAFGFDPASHLTETDPRCTPQGADRLLASWRPWWDEDAQVWLEKSPPNIVRFRFLQGLFPGSPAIAVVRHPVAVALATTKWTGLQSLARLVEHWCVVHERFLGDLGHLHPVSIVRYEEFTQDPRTVIDGLAEQLGVSPQFDVSAIRPDGNARYAAAWAERRAARTTGPAARRLVRRLGARVAELGYDLEDLDAHLSSPPWGVTR